MEQLLTRYETPVYRMALTFLKDPGRAEDITQDIFLKLWRALPDYDGRASPGTWLYTIARNTCLSAARSASYRKTIPLESTSEPAAPAAAPSGDVELAQCIDRLPETQRTVITLFYLQERRVDEVARMLGIPEGTVKSHLYRARLALGEMMKES
uniref:RNA polymerase, sigma-24 subunit, ECF subfamily n=1 Tax=Solibacter usitatus (strain Ellin6076) TaxID=234267 RepID=Q024S5_SOLUE